MLFARLKFLENFPLPSSFFEDNYFRAKINLPCDQRKKENSLEKGSACSRPISSLTLCSNHFSRICAQWTPAASTGPLSSQSRGIVRAILDPGINGASLARWQARTRDRASAAEISPNFSRTFSVYVPFMRGHVLKSRPPFLSAYSIDSAVWTHDAKHACRDGHRYRPVAEGGGSFSGTSCLRANVAAVTGGRAEERWKWL